MKKHWPPFNFSAGPALLPREVMSLAQEEFTDWQGTGLSIMEFSHRGDHFMSIAAKAEQDLRSLLSIPSHYRVLFMAGGASFQFASIPLNFLRQQAVYVNTGIWGDKAVKEARKFGSVYDINGLCRKDNLTTLCSETEWSVPNSFDYLHYTSNETIGGIEFSQSPNVGKGKLIADMSSNILSQSINVEDFALIYAGAQKNIGPAGLTIVIVREDILEQTGFETVPSLMQYNILAKNDSMYNTPPTYSWYLAGLVFDWLIKQGGVKAMETRARQKSDKLYQYIDGCSFYSNPVHPESRSRMNIPFTLADDQLNGQFLSLAEENGLVNLKGHRSVGGMRASLYNAMPEEGVSALIEFMGEFAKTHG